MTTVTAGDEPMSKKSATGTREWAAKNENVQMGCPHDCRYCYARADALRYGRIKALEDWKCPVLYAERAKKRWRKRNYTIMYPSTHDITPENIEVVLEHLGNILEPGNRVLIVSKPWLECVKAMCDRLEDYKDNILFRFTIGSVDEDAIRFWEPNAPSYRERRDSLRHAFEKGFQTSISSEPLLDRGASTLVENLGQWVTDAHWLGPMNKMELRVYINGVRYKQAMEDMGRWDVEAWGRWHEAKRCHDKKFVEGLYRIYKSNLKVKWKNEYKKILGLDKPKDIGLDI